MKISEAKATDRFMGIDMCIIMDCTNSMAPFLDACKSTIVQILERVHKDFGGHTVRVSFIGYRDFPPLYPPKDDNSSYRDAQIINTGWFKFEDRHEFVKELKKIRPVGNTDYAEDVAGALAVRLRMAHAGRADWAHLK